MSAFLYLLPLGLIFDLGGYMPPYVRLFLIFVLLGLPLCLQPSKKSGLLALGLLVAMGARAWFSLGPMAEIALLLLAHQTIWVVTAKVPRSLQAGVVVYAMVHLFLFHSPLGHPWLEGLAGIARRISFVATGDDYNLGWTYQNVGAFVLFFCISVLSCTKAPVTFLRTSAATRLDCRV